MKNSQIETLFKNQKLRAEARRIRNRIKSGKLPSRMFNLSDKGLFEKVKMKAKRYILNFKDKSKASQKGFKLGTKIKSLCTIRMTVDAFAFEHGIRDV